MDSEEGAGPMRELNVVLHVHSTWSYDGKWKLDALARFYGRLGADVVMMTEHDTGFDPDSYNDYRKACEAASTKKCRLVPGIEYSCPDNDIHILTWGLNTFLAEHSPVLETLTAVKQANGAAIFAHPIRRDAWAKYDHAWTPLLHGIEVWNRKSDGVAPGTEAVKLIAQSKLPATVGQDFHTLRHYWPLTMRVEASNTNPVPDIVAALRAGTAVPHAFGRRLLDANGQVSSSWHTQLERLRVAIRDTLRHR